MDTREQVRAAWLLMPPMIAILAGVLVPIRPPGAFGYELDPMRWVPIGMTLGGLVALGLVVGLAWGEKRGKGRA